MPRACWILDPAIPALDHNSSTSVPGCKRVDWLSKEIRMRVGDKCASTLWSTAVIIVPWDQVGQEPGVLRGCLNTLVLCLLQLLFDFFKFVVVWWKEASCPLYWVAHEWERIVPPQEYKLIIDQECVGFISFLDVANCTFKDNSYWV